MSKNNGNLCKQFSNFKKINWQKNSKKLKLPINSKRCAKNWNLQKFEYHQEIFQINPKLIRKNSKKLKLWQKRKKNPKKSEKIKCKQINLQNKLHNEDSRIMKLRQKNKKWSWQKNLIKPRKFTKTIQKISENLHQKVFFNYKKENFGKKIIRKI